MTALRLCGAGWFALIVCAAACKKEQADTTPISPEASAVLAHVPADTPYLIAGIESLPQSFTAWLQRSVAPLVGLGKAAWDDSRKKDKLFDAILTELDGKWSAAGLESLGLSSTPRFALFGLGLQPVVLRLSIKDDQALRATIERIATRAGEALPPLAHKHGRDYWHHRSDDGTGLVIALADNQFILAIGEADAVDAKLAAILGSEKPARSLASGVVVNELRARHHFGGQFISFIETRRVAAAAIEAAGGTSSPGCNAALDRLSVTMPRMVLGYRELSGTQASGALVIELSPDAMAAVSAVRTEFPGLGELLALPGMYSLGVGLDLAKGQQVAVAVASYFKQLGEVCALSDLADSAGQAALALGRPLPEPLDQITGGAGVITDIDIGPDGEPSGAKGIAIVASPDARGLYNQLLEDQPVLATTGIVADGKLHHVALAAPFLFSAGVGDRLAVLSAGDENTELANKLLATRAGAKSPLLTASYDMSKFIGFAMRSDTDKLEDPELRTFMEQLAKMFGRGEATLQVTDQGIEHTGSIELR